MMRSAPWLPLGVLALLVALTFWLDRLVRPDAARPGSAGRNDPDLILEQFSARKLGPDGAVRHTLTARRMTHHPVDDTSRLEAVSFESVATDQPRVRATSTSGTVSDDGKRVEMEGNVIVAADATEKMQAWRLSTPKMTLLPDDNLAQSDAGIRFESRDLEMTANSFTFNTETRVLKLREIKATYHKKQD